MPDITASLSNGRLKVSLLLGTNMLSSFADAGHVADGLDKAEMVICVDLFMNETARRFADVVLPGTAWLEGAPSSERVRRVRSTKSSGRWRIPWGSLTAYPGHRWKRSSTPSWIIQQPATRR